MLVHLLLWVLDVALLLQQLCFLEIVLRKKKKRSCVFKETVHLASLEWNLKLLAGAKTITSKVSISPLTLF